MNEQEFNDLAYRMWEGVPPSFKERIVNVALLIEDEPDEEVAREEGLDETHTLLGLYRGIPNTLRGEGYGVGMTLPDTITLYRLPILEAAKEERAQHETMEEAIRKVLRETLWHEVGHYFGLTEEDIHEREVEGTNAFSGA